MSARPRHFVGALRLPQNFSFANDHGIEAAGYAEQVAYGLFLAVFIHVRGQLLAVNAKIAADKVH